MDLNFTAWWEPGANKMGAISEGFSRTFSFSRQLPECFQHTLKMVPRCAQDEPRWAKMLQNGAKVVPKSSRNDPKMLPKWAKMRQDAKHGPEMVPR